MKNTMDEVDFVIPWVDGSDPAWLECKSEYSHADKTQYSYADNQERFRDWELLRYWFRGVENYAPFVRQIHFITWGHLPKWLNTNHPKLHIVNHQDYIPSNFLPTFSSVPIELNLHRIPDLAEHFVYFNDDIFIIDKINVDTFFKNGLPRSTVGLSIPGQVCPEFGSSLLRNYEVINRNFNSRSVLRKLWTKFINPRYGVKRNLQTLFLLPYCREFFPGFYNMHGPNAFLKSTFQEVWAAEEDLMNICCKNKFRTPCEANQYVFLWWQWCQGKVVPTDYRKIFSYMTMLTSEETITDVILKKRTPIVAINDAWCEDFNSKAEILHSIFDNILGMPCSFEK